MSVIIKGIEMPTTTVLFCIHPDGKVFADLEGGWKEYKAVPVPPHGDLIDVDALLDMIESAKQDDPEIADVYEDDRQIVLDWLTAVPTVIPAGNGGNMSDQKKRKTNADRIRSMTDEELADWLIMNGDGSDYQTWLEWLRKEAES